MPEKKNSLFHSRKGFELATNTLVVIILGIVMLGMGIFVFIKLQNTTADIATSVDEGMRRQIEDQMISSSEKVAIPFVTKEVSRGKMADFYMGIENVYDNEHAFKIIVEMKTTPPSTGEPPHFVLANDLITIKPHERGYVRLNFFAPKDAPLQQYSFLVTICYIPGSDLNDDGTCTDTTYSSYYPPKQMVYLSVK